jgi:hypothetical protein
MQNGYVESFNGRMRDELLNETLFLSLGHAREVIAAWVEDYNTERPHSSRGYATPAAFAAAGLEKRRPAPVQAVALHAPMRNHDRRSLVPTWMKVGVRSGGAVDFGHFLHSDVKDHDVLRERRSCNPCQEYGDRQERAPGDSQCEVEIAVTVGSAVVLRSQSSGSETMVAVRDTSRSRLPRSRQSRTKTSRPP